MAASARSYKARGIVLRSRNLGEADRILTLFTFELGKLDAVAKGVRRSRSRVGGRLEFGNEVAMTLHRGRSLDVIAQSEILREHWSAIVEPQRFTVAAAACELVDAFSEPDLAMPDVYALLAGMLAGLAKTDEPRVLLPRFQMRLLDALGIAPPLEACIRCGNGLGTQAWLDVEAGGLVDDRCRERWRDMLELDAAALQALQGLAAPRGRHAGLRAGGDVAATVDLLIAHHLGRRPRAFGVLMQ